MASKRQKQCQDVSGDRLSSLPDPIIHHIFSYLPTLFIIRTSLCIKPLQHIWRSIFSIDLSDTDDPNFDFYNFINSFIRGRDASDIDKLRIRCGNLQKDSINQVKQVNKCLTFAMKKRRRIHALDLEVSDSYGLAKSWPFKMTRRILTCSSLKELKLSLGGFRIDFPTCICLPLLTKLDLYRVKFYNHKQNESFFSQIPLLETLIIQDWKFSKNMKKLTIRARQLKHLGILDHSLPDITFLTPNIVSLQVLCHYRLISFGENLVNLAIADIDVSVTGLPIRHQGFQIVGADDQSTFVRTIRVLQNTSSLTLSSKFIQTCGLLIKKEASSVGYNRIQLSNLKFLKLKTEFSITSIVCLNAILKNSPNIETLEISQVQKPLIVTSKPSDTEDEDLGYGYQFMNLKSVFIQNMDLTGITGVTFLLHLLKNSLVLQNVVLDQPQNLGNSKTDEIEAMLRTLPPASHTVQILIK